MPATQHQPVPAETGAATRRRLLDTAEALFAERGFTAASVRDITAAAGCNLAAVNYHFGGKRNLYSQVFRRRLTALREQRIASVEAARERAHSLEAVLTAFAEAFLRPLVPRGRGRSVLDLILREMLDPQLPSEMYRSEFVEPVQGALVSAMMSTTPGLDPGTARMCAVSVIGQLVQVAQRYRRARLEPSGEAAMPSLKEIVAQVVRFSAAGVRACAREGA